MQKLRKMVKSIDKSREREYYSIHIISERNEYIMELPKPNNTHSSEAAKQMEFAEGFNPELTTEEKLRAAAEFDDLVWLTLLRFAGDAETDLIYWSVWNPLCLIMEIKNDPYQLWSGMREVKRRMIII